MLCSIKALITLSACRRPALLPNDLLPRTCQLLLHLLGAVKILGEQRGVLLRVHHVAARRHKLPVANTYLDADLSKEAAETMEAAGCPVSWTVSVMAREPYDECNLPALYI